MISISGPSNISPNIPSSDTFSKFSPEQSSAVLHLLSSACAYAYQPSMTNSVNIESSIESINAAFPNDSQLKIMMSALNSALHPESGSAEEGFPMSIAQMMVFHFLKEAKVNPTDLITDLIHYLPPENTNHPYSCLLTKANKPLLTKLLTASNDPSSQKYQVLLQKAENFG